MMVEVLLATMVKNLGTEVKMTDRVARARFLHQHQYWKIHHIELMSYRVEADETFAG